MALCQVTLLVKELAHLNKYLFKYKWHLILGTVFLIISVAFQIIPAQLVRNSIDLVAENLSLQKVVMGLSNQAEFEDVIKSSILVYGVTILALALLRGFFLFLVRQTIIVMSRLIEYDLKNEVYVHYQSLPLSFYRANNTGDLMNRISEDVSKVRMYLGPAIMYGVNLVVLFGMLIPYMFSVSTTLTLYALLPLPFLSVSIYFVNNIINKRSEEIQQGQSALSTYAQEAFSGIRVLKAFAREVDSLHRFTDSSNDYKDRSLKLTKVNALFFPLISGVIGMSTILIVYVGGAKVIEGSLSFGNIAEFIIYTNLLTWPVTSLGWVTSIVQRAAASQKRINEFLLQKTEITSDKNLEKEIKGKVNFDKVDFTYPDSGIHAVKSLSFELLPGESLAIIGTTGSGKSTVANLLGRLYDISSGLISIDGIDIKDYSLSSLRGQMGYVPQDVFLFSDTIRNNIAFSNNAQSAERIEDVAKDADVYDNIIGFENQFETRVGERGITLSGGQKQRVSIARAIAHEPKILILDDCLSAVDTKTENTILNSMKRVMTGRTSIVISHRVSSAKLADKIIVLDEGAIVEEGTHDQLMAKSGAYKALYEKQLQAEEVAD